MGYFRSLQSELLKLKGSIIIWLSIFGGLLLSIVFSLRYIYVGKHINQFKNPGAWEHIISQNTRPFLGFLAPIGLILICLLITQIEYKNNNWKQVHTTPQGYGTIFFAKFTVLIMITLFVIFLVNVGILLHGALPSLVLEGNLPKYSVPFSTLLSESIKCFMLILPIIGFQYLLSLHFRNFMIAFGVGLTIYVGSMPAIKLGLIGFLSPYSYVLNNFDMKIQNHHYLWAFVYFLGLFLLTYFLYIYKRRKG